LPAAALAQNWQVGGGIGYGFYHNASISGPAGTAEAGILNRYAVTATASEDLYEHVSGEFRYVYNPGDTFLKSGSTQGSMNGFSHTFTYDALLHLRPRESRIRPYAAFGVGAKYFGTSGTPPKVQPVPAIAGLVKESQWEPAFDVGAGVKFRVTDHFVVSADLRDCISIFPDHLFSLTGTAHQSGVLQQLTPTFGVAFRF
jgi:opacity protein-like surface antigen